MNNAAKILVVFILFVFTASCAHAKVVINDFLVDLIDKNNVEQPYIHTKYDYKSQNKFQQRIKTFMKAKNWLFS